MFLILTTVEKVFCHFGHPCQKPLDNINLEEAKSLLEENHFGKGSMETAIRAAIQFLKEANNWVKRKVVITLPETAMAAIQGKTGTRIYR